MSTTNVRVSVIVTLCNNGDQLKHLHESLLNVLKKLNGEFEIIYVDDGSIDDTFNVLSEIATQNKNVNVVKMRSTFGEASAFDAGLKYSRGEIIIYFTARVSINPHGLLKLLDKLQDGNDLVIGWRYPRRDSKLNQIISKAFNTITGKLSRLKLHDINSGVMVIKREVLEQIQVYGGLSHFVPVLAVQQGYKVAEEKIEQLPGNFRTSRYLSEYLQRILDIITVIFLINYSKKPIHFLGFMGAIFTLVGAGVEIYLFIYRILGMGPIAGRPLLLLGALLLVIGIQMISIGLLGEMIIFTHAGDIKEYNIEKIVE